MPDYTPAELKLWMKKSCSTKMGQRDAAIAHKQQLEVEKEFLEAVMATAPSKGIRLQIMACRMILKCLGPTFIQSSPANAVGAFQMERRRNENYWNNSKQER